MCVTPYRCWSWTPTKWSQQIFNINFEVLHTSKKLLNTWKHCVLCIEMKTANVQNGKEVKKETIPRNWYVCCVSFIRVACRYGTRAAENCARLLVSTFNIHTLRCERLRIKNRDANIHMHANDGEIVVDCVVCFCFFCFEKHILLFMLYGKTSSGDCVRVYARHFTWSNGVQSVA